MYPIFENVVTREGKVWMPEEGKAFDVAYCMGFFSELRKCWPEFKKYTFVVHLLSPRAPIPEFPIRGQKVILLLLAEESGLRALDKAFREQFFAVLRTHLQTGWTTKVANLLPFPLGDSLATEGRTPPSFNERKWLAGFIGNYNANRLDVYRSMTPLQHFPPWPFTTPLVKKGYSKLLKTLSSPGTRDFRPQEDVYFTFTSGFAKGIPLDEYGQLLADTKIAVCPKGFMRAECYRIFEAMRMGCVVIADELPEQRWYSGSPIIIQKNWLKVHDTIRQLHGDPERMLKIHHDMLAWWDEVCSPRAAARFLAGELDTLRRRALDD